MRVAVLISGRLKCYESCLIPLLESCDYDVDLFISINAERDDYHNQVNQGATEYVAPKHITDYLDSIKPW